MNLFDLFATRAAAAPSDIYLIDAKGQRTFAQVHAAALARSRWLKQQGVAPGSTVVVVAGRSFETVETLFALLRLGANIVPLDHHEPAQRVSDLIEITKPAFILSAAAPGHGANWLDINAPVPAEAGDDGADEVAGDAIAFTFFTSGSTGRPKGIQLSHTAIAAGQIWLQSYFKASTADRQLFRTTLGVTNLLREIIWPVVGGFSAYILPDGASADVAAHVEAIDAGAVTIMGTVPILVDAIISARKGPGSLGSLRTLICTSDRFTVKQLRRFTAELPRAEIYNIYGLTEALYIAVFDCARGVIAGESVPVGAPAELRPIVLDDNLEPAGTSEIGRIYISGTGILARYWNDPVLTDSRFVTLGDVRYFDTGDYGHIDDTGTMHLAGRSEFIIKIGGQRVDVFDLERAFTVIAGVAEACVVPVDIGGGVKRLTAFVVADSTSTVTEHDLRSALARSVPDYMLPNQIRFTDSLPRLHNGKLDRQGLAVRLAVARHNAPPAAEGGATIDALIGTVLNTSRIDPTKTIVELGGDSISAFLISVRAYEMGLQIDPTVLISRSIADAISSAVPATQRQNAPRSERSGQIEHLSDYGWSDDEINVVRSRLAVMAN